MIKLSFTITQKSPVTLLFDYAITTQLTGEFTALEVFFLQIGGKRKKTMVT